MPVMQDDMFGQAHPVFEGVPAWLEPFAGRIWWLWGEGTDQRIADDDAYLIAKYWIVYEGLGAVLGEEALMAFVDWFVATPGPTPPETLRRTRQWLTSSQRDGGAHMPETPETHARRGQKRKLITEQMQGDAHAE